MRSTWKGIHSRIAGAVFNLDSVDALLQQTTGAIASTFQVGCCIWAGLGGGTVVQPRIYATLQDWEGLEAVGMEERADTDLIHSESTGLRKHDLPVRQFRAVVVPDWLEQQQEIPQLTHLENGDLLVPVVNRWDGVAQSTGTDGGVRSLQLVIHLKRTAAWTLEELESLEVVASQLGLAYSALYWRQWLEQSRQQAALVGRIAHLLNSTLNSNEIVERIVAELGQGLQCDRCILVNLRANPVTVMAIWDHPDRSLPIFQHHRMERELWQEVIDQLQGGASYLTVGQSETEEDTLRDWLKLLEAASVMLIPLFVQAEFSGAVCLLSYGNEREYLIDELQTVRQVADHAAIALTNAQHYQSLWHQQEALRLQNTSLQQEIIRDELTQLMNRRSLERELTHLSSKALWTGENTFSIILCDIDYFKLVNDTYGHRVGDEVLQILAQRVRQQLRRETPAYRYGGEELVVVLPRTSLNTALGVAERLRYAIRSVPMKTSAGAVEVTASFGVAHQDLARDHHAWDVLQRSDRALYEAKRQGRDRVKAA